MKKALTILTTVAVLAAASNQKAAAGDREWATAGKVLTGIGAGLLLMRAVEPAPTIVYQPAPTVTYVPAPFVAPQPAPVIVQQAPAPAVVYQQPVYVQSPVCVQPAPVIVARPPIYVAPAPVFGFHFSFCNVYHRHHRW